jgi:transposase InsO family protein
MSEIMPIFIKNELLARREYLMKRHLYEKASISQISRETGISRDTLHRWKKNYAARGALGLLPQSRKPKNSNQKTNNYTVGLIKKIRKETPRFGARKIQIRLEKKYGIKMSWQGVHKVLGRERLIPELRRVPKKDKWQRKRASHPGELVQLDIKYACKIQGKWLYQYTATDVATKTRQIEIYEGFGNYETLEFAAEMIRKFRFKIQAIQTDNASCFTNIYAQSDHKQKKHPFDLWCEENKIRHLLIDKGKPAQNGCVERSHRTDNEEFYQLHEFRDINILRKKVSKYLKWYNTKREHLGINGLTPQQKYLELISQI